VVNQLADEATPHRATFFAGQVLVKLPSPHHAIGEGRE
jgi:hypothetical protein